MPIESMKIKVKEQSLEICVVTKLLLYFPTQILFLIGGERVTCHGSKLINFLGRKKLLTSQGKKNLNFRLARDQVVHLNNRKFVC